MSLHLHIDRVVLRDFDLGPSQRAALLRSLERDLAQTFQNWQPSPAWLRATRLGPIAAPDIPILTQPHQLSLHLSRALHQRLSSPPQPTRPRAR